MLLRPRPIGNKTTDELVALTHCHSDRCRYSLNTDPSLANGEYTGEGAVIRTGDLWIPRRLKALAIRLMFAMMVRERLRNYGHVNEVTVAPVLDRWK